MASYPCHNLLHKCVAHMHWAPDTEPSGPFLVTFTHARSGCGAETGGFWHSRSATVGMFTHTRSGRGQICHFFRTMMVWSARFRSGRRKLGVGPICCGAVFAPVPSPLRDRSCVNACNDLCWSQFSARVRSAIVWTYLFWHILTWISNYSHY